MWPTSVQRIDHTMMGKTVMNICTTKINNSVICINSHHQRFSCIYNMKQVQLSYSYGIVMWTKLKKILEPIALIAGFLGMCYGIWSFVEDRYALKNNQTVLGLRLDKIKLGEGVTSYNIRLIELNKQSIDDPSQELLEKIQQVKDDKTILMNKIFAIDKNILELSK